MKTFELNEVEFQNRIRFIEECQASKKYVKDQERKEKGKSQKHIWSESITFHLGSGIGIGVKIKFGPYKKDITDYGSW